MTTAPNLDSPRPCLGTRAYALATLGFVIFVIYGSLVPFQCEPLSWDGTWTRWQQVCARPLGVDSRSDFATNVILFVPLSFLLVGTLAVGRGRKVAVIAAMLLIPICSALSAAIEFTQLWFPPRVSSLNDVVAETIGAVIGSLVWIVAGQRITAYIESMWIAWGPNNLAVKLLPAYLFILVLIHVMPLDLTLSPGYLYHKWKQGRVVLVPFTTDYGTVAQGIFKTTWNAIYFAPLGWLLSLWPHRFFANGWRVIAAGAVTAAAVEFMQLFVMTRYCDVTDIVTGTAAVWLAWWLSDAWQKRSANVGADKLASNLVGLRVGIFLAWFVMLAVADWYPINVFPASSAAHSQKPTATGSRTIEWVLSADGCSVRSKDGTQTFAVRTVGPFVIIADWQVVQQRWQATPLIPLVDLFADTEYHAFDELVRKTLQFMLLGALLVPASGTSRRAIWAMLAGFCVASFFELGQLFVPDRVCSMSDVVIETGGTLIGFVFFRRLRVLMADRTENSAVAVTMWNPIELNRFVTQY